MNIFEDVKQARISMFIKNVIVFLCAFVNFLLLFYSNSRTAY